MSEFTITREVRLAQDEAWRRVTTWQRHGEHVPLTSVRTTPDGFVARTQLGPIGFDDPMEVAAWDPPRSVVLAKRGRWVRGWARITVEELGDDRSRVTWHEMISVLGVVGPLRGIQRAVAARMFARVLDGLLAHP